MDHRFVMSKFVNLYRYIEHVGLLGNNLFQPKTSSLQQLALSHCETYLSDIARNEVESKAWRRVGLPWSQGLVERTLTAPNGTLLAAELALRYGLASHLAGGTHHAHFNFGSGFCMVNDLAYTALSLLRRKIVKKVLIFDLDVHQGDGTATILANEPNAYTCSIHCEKNFPFRKASSDCDVGLAQGLTDEAYLSVVEATLERLLEQQRPDIVLYDTGVDIWEHDALGKLSISWDGLQKRDERVIHTCLQQHIPVATVIGGGYDKDHLHLARRHAIVVEVAARLYKQWCE